MKDLSKKNLELLEILLSDNKALDNFLIESNNPRFLPSLNGCNSKGLNIFCQGHSFGMEIWKGRSMFIWPSFYLERIATRWKTTDMAENIRKEYAEYILSALKNIIQGYVNSRRPDSLVVQIILRIIKNLGVVYLDDVMISFIIDNFKNGYANDLIWELLEILQQLVDDKNPKAEQLIFTIIDATPNDDFTNNSHFYYLIEEFFIKKENTIKLAEFCDIDFIFTIASRLSAILELRNNIVIEENIELSIKGDNSLNVVMRDSDIQFNLPYVEFGEKQSIIRPIVEEKLRGYNNTRKQKTIEQILYFYTQIWSDFTYISYASLNNPPRDSYKGKESLIIYILKEVMRIKLNKEGIDSFNRIYSDITKNNKKFIFKRILLYCYGKNFEQSRHVLFALLDTEKVLLFSRDFEAEIYNIMEENALKFTDEEKERIGNWIQSGPYKEINWLDDEDIVKYNSELAKMNWQQEYYAPLKKVEPFKSRYQALCEKTRMKEFFYFKDGGEFHPSNYKPMISDKEALSKIKNNPSEYVSQIEKFSKERHSRSMAAMYGTPHDEGNADQLQRLARNHPRDITEVINGLAKLRPAYIMHILYGLRETQSRQNILWPNLFKFIETYVNSLPEDGYEEIENSFDDIISTPKGRNKEFTIGAFVDIISTKLDSDLFDRDAAITLLSKFLVLLLQKYHFVTPMYRFAKGKEIPADYLTMAINTALGKVLEKLILLIITRKVSDIERIKCLYDDMLKNGVVEAYVFLGIYFRYFYQVMKDWTIEKTTNILNSTSNGRARGYWKMFFEGFIKSNTQCLDYYDWMGDHYKRAIDVYPDMDMFRLPDLLVHFFLAGKDKLDKDSLIGYCYEKSAFTILKKCISCISFKINKSKFYGYNATAEETNDEKKVVPKAKELWHFLWQGINTKKLDISNPPKEIKSLLEEMLELIPALDILDSCTYGHITQILDGVNPKIRDRSHIFSNLIYLVSKADNDENAVLYLGRIYKKIIENMDYFISEDWHREIVKRLINNSSDKNIKKIVKEIQGIYVYKSWNRYLKWFSSNE